jgi:hypothetical protein
MTALMSPPVTAKAPNHGLGAVRRVSVREMTPEQFASEYRGKEPVVLKGFAKSLGWSVRRWADRTALGGLGATTERPLAQLYTSEGGGHSQFSSVVVDGGGVTMRKVGWAEGVDAVFAAATSTPCAQVEGGTLSERARGTALAIYEPCRCYLKSALREGDLQDLSRQQPDALFCFCGVTMPERSAKVWVGSEGNVTPLHFDLCHGVIAQVVGRKRVTLFPPSASALLYPFRAGEGPPHSSRVDLDALLFSNDDSAERAAAQLRFPVASAALAERGACGGLQCDVAPGEALYFPPFWWHHVAAVDLNVSALLPFDLSFAEQRAAPRPWCQPDWGATGPVETTESRS